MGQVLMGFINGAAWLPGRRYIAGLAVAAAALTGATCQKDPTEPGTGRVAERWYQSQTRAFSAPRPTIAGDLAYFAMGDGVVVARDVLTGILRWSVRVGSSPHAASAEIGGDNLLVRNGILVVPVAFHTSGVDAASGRELWRYEAPLDTIDKSAPRPGSVEIARIAADENTVYVPAWGATVSALDLQTGRPRWVWRVDASLPFRSGSSGVQVSGDTVFATVWHFLDRQGLKSEAWLLALDKYTGREFWRVVLPRQSTGVMIECAPALWRNLVFVTIITGDLFAVDRVTQQVAWHVERRLPLNGLPTAVVTGPEVYGDFVYADGSDQKLHAYRVNDGSHLWEAETGQLDEDLLVTDKYIYSTNGPELLVIDRNTGRRYAGLRHPRRSVDYLFSSSAAAYNGQIFVTLSDAAWSFDEP